ncbi:MAG: hypothetical protein Tsb0014_38480 [Pleurocapsa sp.]
MKEILTKLVDFIGQAYWIKVTTTNPSCTYYFGPFLTFKEAQSTQPGFVEDLESENAQEIKAEIKRCQPQELTIFDELNDNSNHRFRPIFNSQSI